jgi:hypothetical protein
MKIERIDITPMEFNEIPDAERAMLVLLGHAMNEVNILTKLFVVAGQFHPEPRWHAHGQVCQALTLGRMLTGKLHEMWQSIVKGYLRTPLSKKYGPDLDPEGKLALDALKKHFGKKNLVSDVRNQFSFHYSLEAAKRKVEADTSDREMCIYFGSTNGTSLYQFAEEVMGMSMLASINKTSPQEAFDKLIIETSDITGWLNAFAQRLMYLILENAFSQERLSEMLKPMTISSPSSSREAIKLPFFAHVKPLRRAKRAG